MKLSNQDADLFFELMFSLQVFINQRLGIVSDISTLEEYLSCRMEQKLLVRDALYENTSLIDEFIQQNPHAFSPDYLTIIAQWKQFVIGEFFIERLLKKYAIFIGSDEKVYGVLALHEPFQETVHPSQLPLYVRTVLLPFKGKIVYDGLIQPYSVFFGGGISFDLKETYMAAKQNSRIIESLEPGLQPIPSGHQRKRQHEDWGSLLDKLMEEAKKLRSGSDQPTIQRPAFSLVKASLELAQSTVHDPDDLDALRRYLKKVDRNLEQVETTLHRAERYR